MQFYSASFLGDMYEVVAHVSNRYPAANLYAIGWSLGANILVRCLGHVTQSIHFVLINVPLPFVFVLIYLASSVRAALKNVWYECDVMLNFLAYLNLVLKYCRVLVIWPTSYSLLRKT